MIDERCTQQMLQSIDEFHAVVTREGADLLRRLLDETWFTALKRGITIYYENNEKQPLAGNFFPFEWLWERCDWWSINAGLKRLATFTPKKAVLRHLVQRLTSRQWEDGFGAALEIAALTRFLSDGTLVDIQPLINREYRYHADALIKVDRRDILVEVTAIARPRRPAGPPQEACISVVIETSVLVDQMASKIRAKIHDQLFVAEDPLILIVALPPPIGVDQQTARWAIQKLSAIENKISAFVVSDTYRLKCGTVHFNNTAQYGLTFAESKYLSNLVIPTTQPL